MRLHRLAAGLALGLLSSALAQPADAFCGFYVAKADASLFNKASQVILARDGERTTITMLNDYQGDPKEFALVVPVPKVLKQDDVRVVAASIFDTLDGFSMPRLVEYFDPNPCERPRRLDLYELGSTHLRSVIRQESAVQDRAIALGVQIENTFTVGEYEILILSATQSDGLETWLVENGYRLPSGAAAALKPYVGQKMKFFVAKVRLDDNAGAFRKLRPLQFTFDSPRFMLPMRLGMLNANGPQDLIVYTLTRKGRVEAANYRTARIATDTEIPLALRDAKTFGTFYGKLFEKAAEQGGFKTVFTEFAWDAGWCDPCAAPPPSAADLVAAGASWVPNTGATQRFPGKSDGLIVTRLHLRYTPESFPEDLVLHETGDRTPFQARYIVRHAAKVSASACAMAQAYILKTAELEVAREKSVVDLTGLSTRDFLVPPDSMTDFQAALRRLRRGAGE